MVFLEHRPRVYYSVTTAVEATALFVQQQVKGAIIVYHVTPDCGTPASDVLSLAGDLPPPSSSAENDSAVSASSIAVVAPVERLSDAHPETSHSEDNLEDEVSSSESLDLMSCEAVVLDVRDVPGVSFVKDGVEQWSPAVRRRVRPKENSSSSDGSDLDLDNCQASCHIPHIAWYPRSCLQVRPQSHLDPDCCEDASKEEKN